MFLVGRETWSVWIRCVAPGEPKLMLTKMAKWQFWSTKQLSLCPLQLVFVAIVTNNPKRQFSQKFPGFTEKMLTLGKFCW